jgi:K+-transporting ATPase KdpF subunit
MDADTARLPHHREPAVRQGPRGAALMQAQLPYIITGIVALIVTIYLFAALLYPEKF